MPPLQDGSCRDFNDRRELDGRRRIGFARPSAVFRRLRRRWRVGAAWKADSWYLGNSLIPTAQWITRQCTCLVFDSDRSRERIEVRATKRLSQIYGEVLCGITNQPL